MKVLIAGMEIAIDPSADLKSIQRLSEVLDSDTLLKDLYHEEKINAACALHGIDLIVCEDEHDSSTVIKKHDYACEDQRVQMIVDHIKETILSPDTSSSISKRVYLEVLALICDSYTYETLKSVRRILECVSERTKTAFDHQWNAGRNAYSNLNQFIKDVTEKSDRMALETLLENLVKQCKGNVEIESSDAFKEACSAIGIKRQF